MPYLSFIVGFRNRDTERVVLFLESLKAINSDDFELVFVDYGSDEAVSEKVKKIVSNYDFANYYFSNTRGQNWNRAKCLNYGYAHCKGKFIFTSDIDFLYSKNFISTIKEIVTPTQAFYFKVGFLTEKQSQNIHLDSEKYDIESYSDEEAIGALLISREMFDEVGGYDEFYEIWGVEDNDLLHRIKMTKNQITFFNSKTIIWHIWHLPVKQTSILPNGWLKFLKDYFEHKKQTITACNQNYYCKYDITRPIINNRDKINLIEININCSIRFLSFLLKHELLRLKTNDALMITFCFSEYNDVQKSTLNKLVKKINAFFVKFKSSLFLNNSNMSFYIGEQEAKDELQYFIKLNNDLIIDFYIPDNLLREPTYILRK